MGGGRTLILMFVVGVALSCGHGPEKVSLSDPRLKPMLDAIAAVDRQSLGFAPIASGASVTLETANRAKRGYDVMLHVFSPGAYSTIALWRTRGGYQWVGEQEAHYGPLTYTTVDGTFNEDITITYDTIRISGYPLNQTCITYDGPDSRLAPKSGFYRSDLTLAEVQPILEEWRSSERENR